MGSNLKQDMGIWCAGDGGIAVVIVVVMVDKQAAASRQNPL